MHRRLPDLSNVQEQRFSQKTAAAYTISIPTSAMRASWKISLKTSRKMNGRLKKKTKPCARCMKRRLITRGLPVAQVLSMHTKGSALFTGTWFQNCCLPYRKMYSPQKRKKLPAGAVRTPYKRL